GGHSDTLGGVVSGRHELALAIADFRRRTGGVLSADVAWLLVRSFPTLVLRVRAASDNALHLARFLDGVRAHGGAVERVHYPGLPEHPDHAVATRRMEGFGAILAFEVKGGLEGARGVYDRFDRIGRAVSLGGVETIASLPLHTSHSHATT